MFHFVRTKVDYYVTNESLRVSKS